MRSGVIHVLLVLLIRRDGSGAADDFKPTPIPLNEWREVRGGRAGAGALRHELRRAAPPRYWEDALRHSVYLTLVRDKIDQLIAKGKHEDQSKEIDDRDLWDKVKQAPFERTESEEPVMFGDVAIMAKGKLMDDHHGFRFAENDKFKDDCAHDGCMDGVKALWSVKRERQRDAETFPGRYHYELTFSVITQTQKKHKPYEKPARTFTVRESVPEKIVEMPKEHRYYEPSPVQAYTPRAERAIWFHKNIAPTARNQARQHQNGLDRLFSSLFTDDEELPPPRYKPKQYIPQSYQQYSKVGYVGSPSEHQQKKLNPYGPKPHSYKYSRPIPPPPPQSHGHHHYLDIDAIGVVSNPYTQDHRHGSPYKNSKTQRPPVLPTPPNPVLPQKNFTIETTTKLKPHTAEETTQQPEHVTHRTYSKQKPTTFKISYATDHVRPPVYNTPPGVFVTMDKKPFKPMPPLRLVHSSKLHKTTRPTDFRPSPQVLDIQFSEPDPLFDTAFRPITVNYANNNTTEKAVVAASDSHLRKSNSTVKKPPKKHENIKAQRVTTPAPEIITAHSVVDSDSDAEWTNVLGAFAKTTPMAADKDKTAAPEPTTPLTTSTTITTSTPAATTPFKKRTTTTTTEAPTTTLKPKKRTRPPPKFTKPEKVKKHKRITTTTTTTEAPAKRNKLQDLTPQASSAAATTKLPPSTTTSTTTPTTTTTQATTTPAQTTTTTQPTTTTTVSKPTPTPKPESDHIKRKNRYRQSTLKYRSTSGKDEKKEDKPRTILPPTGNFLPRRKGSKFQGHIPSSTPVNTDKQYDEEGREDHVVSPYKSKTITTTESLTAKPEASTEMTHTTTAYEEVADHIYITSESPEYFQNPEEEFDVNSDETEEDEQESRDNSEYLPSTAAMAATPSEKTNEIIENDEASEITEDIVTTTPKNKSKCKKKKHHYLTNTTEETKPETTESIDSEPATSETQTTTTTTTTETSVTPDIFQEIFGGFTFDDFPEETKNNESTGKLEEQETINQEQFIKAEEDFEDFFEAFDDKDRHPDGKFEDEYEYDDKEPVLDDDESLFQSEDDQRSPRDSKDEEAYDDFPERPFSFLELMAME